MPYITEIPSNLLTIGVDGLVAFVPNTSLVNAFEASQEFAQYDVDATGATTLHNGDNITPVDSAGNPLTGAGNYLGSVTVNNAAASVGVPTLANISLQVNPIGGHLMEADGNYYFISDQALDDDHLSVTASIVVAGRTVSVTGPISGIVDLLATEVAKIPIAGPLAAAAIRGVAGVVQTTLNAVAVTMDHDPDGELPLTDEEVTCFVAGTLIETRNGLRAVEDLVVGDEVLTRDRGYQAIRWIGSTSLSAPTLARQPKLRPIRIRAGALAENVPSTDLLVSPQHRILVRSKIAMRVFGAVEVLAPAKQLLQVEGIDIAEELETVEYFHFLCDQHEVVMSNGAETESLYTGKEALKAVGWAAREEIFTLFPQLRDSDAVTPGARKLLSGREARKLVVRHVQNGRDLVM